MHESQWFTKGQQAFLVGDYPKAVRFLDQAIKQTEQNATYFYWRGQAKKGLKQYVEAIADFDQATKLDNTYTDAFYQRGLSRYGLEHHYAALANFNLAIKLNPAHYEAYYTRGVVKQLLKQYREAIADFTTTLELNPTYTDAYIQRASLYYELNEYHAAIADYDKALSVKKCATSYYRCANAKRFTDQHQAALKDFEQAIRLNRNYAMAFFDRGLTHYHLDEYQEALADFEIFSGLKPNDDQGFYWCGRANVDLKHYESALKYFDNAHQLSPVNVDILCHRAQTHIALKSYSAAIADCIIAIRVEPHCAFAFYLSGNAKKGLEKYLDAIEDYTQAIQFQTPYPGAYTQRGLTYYTLGKYQEALDDFNQVNLLKPYCAFNKLWRGNTKKKLGEYAQAIAHYTEALRLSPQDTASLFERGMAYYCLKQHKEALEDFDKVLAFDADHIEASKQRLLLINDLKTTQELAQPTQAVHGETGFEQEELSKNATEVITPIEEQTEVTELNLQQQLMLEKERNQVLEFEQREKDKQIQFLSQQIALLQQQLLEVRYQLPQPYRLLIPDYVRQVMFTLHEAGYYVYLVGGVIRDLLLGMIPQDIDLLTNIPEERLLMLFNNVRKNPFIPQLYEFNQGSISIDMTICDSALFLSMQSLSQDAMNREFTINALYGDIHGRLYDPLGCSLHDLMTSRMIRTIGETHLRFSQDPIILLRAARFVAYYGFKIPTETVMLIKQDAYLVSEVNKHRLKLELKKQFLRGCAQKSFNVLVSLGLFQAIFPKTAEWLTSEQGHSYQAWLIRELQVTDHYIETKQPVSIVYVYALFLTGHVMKDMISTDIPKKKLEDVVHKITHEFMDDSTDQTSLNHLKKMIQLCLTKLAKYISLPFMLDKSTAGENNHYTQNSSGTHLSLFQPHDIPQNLPVNSVLTTGPVMNTAPS